MENKEFIFRVHYKKTGIEAEVRFTVIAPDTESAYKMAVERERLFTMNNRTFKDAKATNLTLEYIIRR